MKEPKIKYGDEVKADGYGDEVFIVSYVAQRIGTDDFEYIIQSEKDGDWVQAVFDESELTKVDESGMRMENKAVAEQQLNLALKKNRAVCFDFDGVLHKYRDGYRDGSIYDEPNMEMIEFLATLQTKGFPCFICSTREPEQIIEWWNSRHLGTEAILFPNDTTFYNDRKHVAVTNVKHPAQIYIDDRAYRYYGQDTDRIKMDLGGEQ